MAEPFSNKEINQAKLAAVTEIMRQYEGIGEGAHLNIIYEIRKAWHNIDAQGGNA